MSLTVSYSCWLSLTVSTIAMDLLHVSHCLFQFHGVAACRSLSPIVAGCLSLPLPSHGVAKCLSLLLAVSCCLSQLHGVAACLSPSLLVTWSFCMSLTVSYPCWLSLTISPVLWCCCMFLTVSNGGWLCLTVSPRAMEFLYVSHCLFQFYGFAACLSLSPKFSGYLSLSFCSHGVATCLSLSPMVAGCLSLSLPAPWSFYLSLIVSCWCWLTLNACPVSWSCYMSLIVAGILSMSLPLP